jgi:hypothetical protein
MERGQLDPKLFGVDMAKEQLTETIVGEFNAVYGGNWPVGELLMHPREALRFCDDVRRKFSFFDLPDDIILRCVLAARKRS